jgi:hypothetical protein
MNLFCGVAYLALWSQTVSSFTAPINIYSRHFGNLGEMQVFEPFGVEKKEIPCVIFFTGGNNIMSHEIYFDVLSELAKQNVSVYIPPFRCEKIAEYFDILNGEYKEVVPVSHSSGFSSLFDLVKTDAEIEKQINKIILLDPVDMRIMKMGKYEIRNVKKMLILNARKTYGTDRRMPFIPDFFRLKTDALRLGRQCVVEEVESAEHGHCDILNHYYADFMFNLKVSDGLEVRNSSALNEYHRWIAKQVNLMIGGNNTL